MLDDFNFVSRGSFQNVTNFKHVCSYLRKACLAHFNLNEVDMHFKQYCKNFMAQQLLTEQEFIIACRDLGLIPEICDERNLSTLFVEMDTAKTQKVTMDQLKLFVEKNSFKPTKDLQDEIL